MLVRVFLAAPLNEVDLPTDLGPVPQLFPDLFRNATLAAASSSSFSSSGASFPHFLSLSFTVEHFDPLDEHACPADSQSL